MSNQSCRDHPGISKDETGAVAVVTEGNSSELNSIRLRSYIILIVFVFCFFFLSSMIRADLSERERATSTDLSNV